MHLRIITYNIHKGIGGIDRRYRLERIIETIAHYAPDIALLQEVDDGVPRSRHDRQVEVLADALGFTHHVYQRNVHLKKGHYGNAILSRYPLQDTGHVDLTIPMKKRRRALVTRCVLSVDGHQRTAIVTNVHLGLAAIERRIQLRRLLSHALLTRHERHTPIVVGGDFNDVWGSLGKRVMYPAGYSSAGKMIRTFPARIPMRALDHIFVRGAVSVENAYAGHTRLAVAASDHLPLVVNVRLRR
ncbi:MAG: endonuclease/exonuclease/phosphatase family protein [Planctomycetota bacterium]